MATKGKGPIVEPALCRCCRSIKRCRLLTAEYRWLEKTEVYADLIMECFGLTLPHLDSDRKDCGICATCVTRLRDAHSFRWQVRQAQEAFLRARDDQKLEGAEQKFTIEVKVEENTLSDHGSDNIDILESDDDAPLVRSIKVAKTRKPRTSNEKVSRKLLGKVEKMRMKLDKKLGEDKKPKQSRKASAKTKLSLDQENMAYTNAVAMVQASYICPFHNRVSNYYCFYCKEQFTDPSELRAHTLSHSPANFEGMLETRKLPKVDVTRVDCRRCDARVEDLAALKRHISSVHGVVIHEVDNEFLQFKLTLTNLKCTECDHHFPYFDALKKHMNDHFGTLVCDKCGACFVEQNSLNSHIRSHKRREINYPCEICGKNLKSKYSRYLHIATVHEKKATVNCYKCEECFLSHALRNRHLIEAHGDKRTFPCKLCDKVYNRRKTLMEHNRRSHLKVLRHQCALCDQRFYIPSRLREHMAAHSGERSYRCELCEKSYPRLQSLQEHVRTHTAERKYKCNMCDSAFAAAGALKVHLKSQHPDYVEGFS